MNTVRRLKLFVGSFFLALAGCANNTTQEQNEAPENVPDAQKEFFCPMHPLVARKGPGKCPICAMPFSEREAGVTKLSPEDQKLVEAQAYCPISDELLGTMGTPFKTIIKGQAVFLCCKDCEKLAMANPDKTLATFEELKAKKKPELATLERESAMREASLTKLNPEDRMLVEAQGSCPVMMEVLGSLGAPIKINIKGQPVFLCCKGCMKSAVANPDKTLATVAEMKGKKKPDVPATPKVEPSEK